MSLIEKRSIFQCLGNLIKNPELLEDPKYKFEREDFTAKGESLFYVIIFAAINNLYNEGAKNIDILSIDSYLSSYGKQYAIFNENKGIEYLQNAIEQSHEDNFDYNYNRLKKFSLLREYDFQGFDIKEVYDDTILNPREQEEMMARFDEMSIKDIVDHYDKKQLEIKHKFVVEDKIVSGKAGEGAKEQLKRFRESPDYGISLIGDMQNAIFRGAQTRTIGMRSAPSNLGKCVVGDTLVYTDKGLIEIQNIPEYYNVDSRGESEANIISYETDGTRHLLPTSHWYNMGHSKTIKIKTRMGYEIEGTPEHPIVISDTKGNTYFKKLQDVGKEDRVVISVNNNLFGNMVKNKETSYLVGFFYGQDEVPETIMMGTRDTVASFLRGWAEGNSQVTDDSIKLYAYSKKASKQLHILLLNFGVVSNLISSTTDGKEFYTLEIKTVQMLTKFHKELGFKKNQFQESLGSLINKDLTDTANNWFIDDIKEISNGEAIVYDFTVPKTHSFVANGIVNHNTRISLSEAVDMAIDEWFDLETQQWTPKGRKENVLFISTETEKSDLEPTMWAYISGVPEEKIKDGTYDEEEEQRLEKAIEILENSGLWIDYIPDFDTDLIESRIKQHIFNNDLKYVFFDYVHISSSVMEELATQGKGVRLREDMVLFMFVDRLEKICKQHDVWLRTASQVNGTWKDSETADSTMLRGAKNMADRLNFGIIMLTPTKKELDAVKPILENRFGHQPNVVYHIYKNRATKYKDCKLWLYIDYNTMRQEEMFLTNNRNELISIKPVTINDDEELVQ